MVTKLYNRACHNRARGNGFLKKEGRFRLDIRKNFFFKDGETLEQIVQRGGKCSVSGNIQGQSGWGSEH